MRSGARREPNTRATTIELFDGLEAASQNRWPSLRFDLLAVNSLLSPFLSAGFYYKTFMWPASFWERVYEPLIRRAAGLGRAAAEPDPDHYEQAYAFCDVLIVGAGAAGLGRRAGRRPRRRARHRCEEDFRLGGRLLADDREIDGVPGARWASAIVAELRGLPECAADAAHDACSASMTAASTARSSGSPIICRRRPRTSRGSGCGRSWPSAPFWRAAPSSGRSFSAATTGRAS